MLAALAVAALLLTGLVARGTVAYFSDTETSTGNTFTAGSVDVAVDGHNPWTARVDANLGALQPGAVGTVDLALTNVGSNAFDVWLRVTDVSTGAGEETALEAADPDSPANDIDGVVRFKLDIDGAPEVLFTEDFTISAGSHQLVGATFAMKEKYIYLGEILSERELNVSLHFRLDIDTTDWAQGDTMTFKVEFYAQQNEAGTEPPPGTELTGHERL
ncbi:MAG: CalY family protein [Dehalococcoidia bacterium]|jgi:predicted ribosomally synthesized peptide with SipW-like signal peptide|nr:CalY family protein [Dehalococcoidia bacterium]